MKKILSIILISLSFSAFSQVKLGHINSADLMQMMPEVDSANQKLAAYTKEVEAEFRTIQTELENKYNEFQANQNQWTDLIKQTKMQSIQDLQTRLENFRTNAENDAKDQQSKLFNPIIEKAKAAIAEVAKEHKYTYIFDTSAGSLLYFGESDDVMALVKKKLNLK